MRDFEPSYDFVDRVMDQVRGFEMQAGQRRERIGAFVFSKPVLVTLSAAGCLLGIWNALRMTLILLSPSLCL